jgi:hypothetical protein
MFIDTRIASPPVKPPTSSSALAYTNIDFRGSYDWVVGMGWHGYINPRTGTNGNFEISIGGVVKIVDEFAEQSDPTYDETDTYHFWFDQDAETVSVWSKDSGAYVAGSPFDISALSEWKIRVEVFDVITGGSGSYGGHDNNANIYNLSATQTGGTVSYDGLTGLYNITLVKPGYFNTSHEINMTINENKEFNPISMIATIRDELTQEVITSNVSLIIVGMDISANYSTTNGTIFIQSLELGDYEIIYDSDDFYLRRYYLTLSESTGTIFNLYLLNTSQTNAALITYELQDENGVDLKNTTIKALRNYPAENAYKIVEMSRSDDNGDGGLHLQKIDPKYKFIVESNGNVIFTGIGAQIFNDNLVIRADTSEDIILSLVTIQAMTDSLTFNNATNNFLYTWNDPTSIVSEVCLTVEKVTGLGISQVNYSCVSSAAGSITLGIGANRTGIYSAIAQVETSTPFSPQISAYLQLVLPSLGVSLGALGLFLGLLIILALALTGMFAFKSAAATGIMAVIGYIASGFLGLIAVTIASVIAVIVILVLILVFGQKTKAGDA